ncbi:MAG: pre-peptidase C-terminal domain-containing protein [Anaerolineaceae bacterium]
MKCPKCDEIYEDTSYFCPNCGAPNESITVQTRPATEPPPGYAQPQAPQPGVPGSPQPKKKNWLWLILVVAAILLVGLVIIAVFLFNLFGGASLFGNGASKGTGILVGVPSKSDEVDVYSLKLGKELKDLDPILENGSLDAGYFYQRTESYGYRLIGQWNRGGGYIEGSKYMLLSYNDDGDMSVYRALTAPKELTPIFESDNDFFGIALDDGDTIYIHEDRGNSQRCYISVKGKEAEQVAKGDYCYLAVAGKVIFTQDVSSKDQLTVKAYDIQGKNEITLVDDEENIRNNSVQISDDGKQIFYLVEDGTEVKIKIIDVKTGKLVAESDPFFDIVSWENAYEGDTVFFIAENEEGLLELYTLDAKGQSLIASEYSMMAQLDKTGENLVYMTGDEDGNQTIYVHPVKGGEDVELISGENLSFYELIWKDVILVREYDVEKNEYTFYSASANGDDLTQVFSESDVSIDSIFNPLSTDDLFIEVEDEEGLSDIFVTKFGSEDGDYLLEDWCSVNFLNINPDGKSIVFSGYEDCDDDPVLYTIDMKPSTDPVELDDDNISYISNAIFDPKGKNIIYTVTTGDNYDDVEVRQVGIDAKKDYEVLFEEAVLLDAQWTSFENFDYSYFSDPLVSASVCPGAPTLELDKATKATLNKETLQTCFRIKVKADQDYTFFATSKENQNLFMELYDRNGNYLMYDDDSGPGFNPKIYWTNGSEAALIFVKITGYNSTSMDLEVTAKEGVYDPSMAKAVEIKTDGSEVSGTIDSGDNIELENIYFEGYADLYYFDGKSGQKVTIDVMKASSTDMDPAAALLDVNQYVLYYDDNSGSNDNALVEYTLASDGRYYILVLDEWNYYGASYDYKIKVTLH